MIRKIHYLEIRDKSLKVILPTAILVAADFSLRCYIKQMRKGNML